MTTDYENRMPRVQGDNHDHPTGNMSLDKLADTATLSHFHFQRTYRLLTGETASQAVRRIRMHRASVTLIHSTTPHRPDRPSGWLPECQQLSPCLYRMLRHPAPHFSRKEAHDRRHPKYRRQKQKMPTYIPLKFVMNPPTTSQPCPTRAITS